MYPKNATSPEPIAIGAVVQISDGAIQSSGCTVRIIKSGVAEGNGAGTTAYSTDGVVLYTPTQAETNYASFVLIAKKTGCIPASVTIVPTATATAGTVVVTTNNDKAGYTASTVSDKTGYALSSTGADLILKSSTFVQAIVAAVNEFATYGLTDLNTLLVATGIKAKLAAADVTGNLPSDVKVQTVNADTAGTTTLLGRLPALTLTTGTVVTSGGANTATSFYTDLSGGDDFWVGCLILITNGALSGQVKKIGDFVDANGVVTLAASETFTGTPADGVTFTIINR
jgi:hypothetical protein